LLKTILWRNETAAAQSKVYRCGRLVSFLVIKRNPVVNIIPDDNKITVFVSGIPNLSGTIIPRGGHVHPISTEGDILK